VSATEASRLRRTEIVATILLAVAAVATAWSTYQSVRWRGEQSRDSTAATAAHIASAQASGRAGQLTLLDVSLFSQWIDADVSGDTRLARFYRQRFRDEFQPAFAAWIATKPRTNPDAPKSPFEMPEYRLAKAEEAEALDAEAVAKTHDAGKALERSDDYMLAVVLFATALFFAGISTRVSSPVRRELLVGIGGVLFLGAAAWVVSLLVADSL
jgi:hypothetical protein